MPMRSFRRMMKMPLFAVRSSATAEDMPDASFAGQQETFLTFRASDAYWWQSETRICFRFNDRAILYRVHRDMITLAKALPLGV